MQFKLQKVCKMSRQEKANSSVHVKLKSGQYRLLPGGRPQRSPDTSRDRSILPDHSRDTAIITIGDHVLPYVDFASRDDDTVGLADRAVDHVVDRYLNAADFSAKAAAPHVPSICRCCITRNRENVKQRSRHHLMSLVNEPREGPRYEHDLGDPDSSDKHIGHYRSDSPDLSINIDHMYTNGSTTATEPTEVTQRRPKVYYLENPDVYKGISYADYKHKPDPKVVESNGSILDAASRFDQSMGRLHRTIDHLN